MKYSGIIAVVVLAAVLVALLILPEDEPTRLPVAVEAEIESAIISGAAGAIDGENHLVALTVSGENRQQPTLAVFGVDNSGMPRLAGSLPAPLDELRNDLPAAPVIALSAGTAYVPLAGSAGSALWIVDVSSPASPRELASIELETEPGSAVVEGDFVAVGPMDGTIVRFFDVSDPARPRALGTYSHALVTTADLELVSPHLLITDKRGISVVDVSSLQAAQEIAYWENDDWDTGPGWTVGGGIPILSPDLTPRIASSTNYLFVAADLFGVDILDVSDPGDPDRTSRRLSQSEVVGNEDVAVDIAASGNDVYVLWRREFTGDDRPRWAYVVQEIDISSPGDPQIRSETDAIAGGSSFKSLAIDESFVYFLNGSAIQVISTTE